MTFCKQRDGDLCDWLMFTANLLILFTLWFHIYRVQTRIFINLCFDSPFTNLHIFTFPLHKLSLQCSRAFVRPVASNVLSNPRWISLRLGDFVHGRSVRDQLYRR